ncbi:MAG: hypothetical protein AAF236_01880 [Verrucomicrobiota bacterium]
MKARLYLLVFSASVLAGPLQGADQLEPIIVSGFEPFGGRNVNASYETAKAIAAAHPDRELTLLEVPVIWGAPEKVLSEQSETPWKLWLAFGEGKNRAFWIETVADNQRGRGRDNAGEQAADPLIRNGAAKRLKSDFPVGKLISALQDRGVPARSSKEAGNYLCEEMLFNLLQAEVDAGEEAERVVLFIHTPVTGGKVILPDGTETSMGPEVMELFAEHILDAVAEALQ